MAPISAGTLPGPVLSPSPPVGRLQRPHREENRSPGFGCTVAGEVPRQFFLALIFVSIVGAFGAFAIGRWRTQSNPTSNAPGAQWRRFGCGLAMALAVLLVLFGIVMFFALGSAGVCCF